MGKPNPGAEGPGHLGEPEPYASAPAGKQPAERHAGQAAGLDSPQPGCPGGTGAPGRSLQLRIADWITGFAGSMNFVYLHIALFTIWMLFIEKSPWPTLTLIVSLEAIFLSTFVMIGQNRQAAFQQAKADHDFAEQELELKTNTELTREIDRLTTELHSRLIGKPAR